MHALKADYLLRDNVKSNLPVHTIPSTSILPDLNHQYSLQIIPMDQLIQSALERENDPLISMDPFECDNMPYFIHRLSNEEESIDNIKDNECGGLLIDEILLPDKNIEIQEQDIDIVDFFNQNDNLYLVPEEVVIDNEEMFLPDSQSNSDIINIDQIQNLDVSNLLTLEVILDEQTESPNVQIIDEPNLSEKPTMQQIQQPVITEFNPETLQEIAFTTVQANTETDQNVPVFVFMCKTHPESEDNILSQENVKTLKNIIENNTFENHIETFIIMKNDNEVDCPKQVAPPVPKTKNTVQSSRKINKNNHSVDSNPETSLTNKKATKTTNKIKQKVPIDKTKIPNNQNLHWEPIVNASSLIKSTKITNHNNFATQVKHKADDEIFLQQPKRTCKTPIKSMIRDTQDNKKIPVTITYQSILENQAKVNKTTSQEIHVTRTENNVTKPLHVHITLENGSSSAMASQKSNQNSNVAEDKNISIVEDETNIKNKVFDSAIEKNISFIDKEINLIDKIRSSYTIIDPKNICSTSTRKSGINPPPPNNNQGINQDVNILTEISKEEFFKKIINNQNKMKKDLPSKNISILKTNNIQTNNSNVQSSTSKKLPTDTKNLAVNKKLPKNMIVQNGANITIQKKKPSIILKTIPNLIKKHEPNLNQKIDANLKHKSDILQSVINKHLIQSYVDKSENSQFDNRSSSHGATIEPVNDAGRQTNK